MTVNHSGTPSQLPAEVWRIIATLQTVATSSYRRKSIDSHQDATSFNDSQDTDRVSNRSALTLSPPTYHTGTGPISLSHRHLDGYRSLPSRFLSNFFTRSDIAALCLICKTGMAVFQPLLYHSIDLRKIDATKLLYSLRTNPTISRMVQHVHWDISTDSAEASVSGFAPSYRTQVLTAMDAAPQEAHQSQSSDDCTSPHDSSEKIESTAELLSEKQMLTDDRNSRVLSGLLVLQECADLISLRISFDNGARAIGSASSDDSSAEPDTSIEHSTPSTSSDLGAVPLLRISDLTGLPCADILTTLVVHQTRQFRVDSLGPLHTLVMRHLPNLLNLTCINCIFDEKLSPLPELPKLEGLCIAFDPDNDDIPLHHLPKDIFRCPNLRVMRYHAPQSFEEELWPEFYQHFQGAIDSMGFRQSLRRFVMGLRSTHSALQRRNFFKNVCDSLPSLVAADSQVDGPLPGTREEMDNLIQEAFVSNPGVEEYTLRMNVGISPIQGLLLARAIAKHRPNIRRLSLYPGKANQARSRDSLAWAEVFRLARLPIRLVGFSSNLLGFEDHDRLIDKGDTSTSYTSSDETHVTDISSER